jgi:hypothetical protein
MKEEETQYVSIYTITKLLRLKDSNLMTLSGIHSLASPFPYRGYFGSSATNSVFRYQLILLVFFRIIHMCNEGHTKIPQSPLSELTVIQYIRSSTICTFYYGYTV